MGRGVRAAAGSAASTAVLLCAALAFAGQPGQKSIRDGVFTADQVEAGKTVFQDVCTQCHTTDIFGPDYMSGWDGASAAELYMMLETMPYENPGALEDTQYASVMVYLFAINGVDSGEEEMPADVNELWDISIDGPFTWKGSGR